MTQANMPAAAQLQDPLVAMHVEVHQQRERLRRYIKEKLPQGDLRQEIYTELDSTFFSFLIDFSEKLIYTRDWLYKELQEEIGALESRIEQVEEEPETQFTAEDAADFGLLCDGAELLAEQSTWKDKKKRDEFIALIAKCRQTIDDGLLTDEEEEDEEEEEGANEKGAADEPVIGGDEAQS